MGNVKPAQKAAERLFLTDSRSDSRHFIFRVSRLCLWQYKGLLFASTATQPGLQPAGIPTNHH